MRKFIIIFFTVFFIEGKGQADSIRSIFSSNPNVFGVRTLIENKGQYISESPITDPIKFAIDNGKENIFFTDKGLVYKITKTFTLTAEEKEEFEHGEEIPGKSPIDYYVKMNWVGANSNILIEKTDQESNYFTYGEASLNSHGYKKITYKNVYNNIDVEFTIPTDKEFGIKYNIVVFPGGDPNQIKIAYTGDVTGNNFDPATGDFKIFTPDETITEHLPVSYYSEDGASVSSAFSVSDNLLSFSFPNGYDPTKTLNIDPWVTSISALGGSNYGYDVDYDNSGNLYVYGGGVYGNARVAKYSSSGSLLWTFLGVVPAASWSTTNLLGNFTVHRPSGKTYIGQAFAFSVGARTVRLDASGNYDNFVTTPMTTMEEIWDMGYDPITGNVYAFGGGTTSGKQATIINQITGSINPADLANAGVGGQDIVSAVIDDIGEIYWIYGSFGTFNNKILKVNSSFSSSIWLKPSTFNSFTEAGNKVNYVGAGINSGWLANGFNCLAVNSTYLFYYDGFNLAAYNKTNGGKIASITVPLSLMQQGGVVVDDCNELYLGGNNAILHYKFTGSSFTVLSPIPLTGYVYDLKLDKLTNSLYVSGSGFVAKFSLASPSCPTNLCCTNGYVNASAGVTNFSALGVTGVYNATVCSNSIFSLNTSTCSAAGLTYSWDFGDGSPVAYGQSINHQYLSPGIYTVSSIVFGAGCAPISQTINVLVNNCTPCTGANINSPTNGCSNNLIGMSINGCLNPLAVYNWSFGDGTTASGISIQHTYQSAGNYNIICTIITPGNPPFITNTVINISACSQITPCTDCIGTFQPSPGDYMVSLWVREDVPAMPQPITYNNPKIRISFLGGPTTTYLFGTNSAKNKIIEGWQRIEEQFNIPTGATDIKMELMNSSTTIDAYFDDLRIFPKDGQMKTYVYDPITLRLTSTLDENNYATFYEYDEEGKLIRVKKETEKGIMTIQENREAVKKK